MAAKESPRTKRHITVRIDEGVMAGVDEVMRETGASMSATVEILLAAGLNRAPAQASSMPFWTGG